MIEQLLGFADWLALREPADAAARRTELVNALRPRLAGRSRLVIHDLGSGTGSMARWLAPLLPGPQHWVLHDQDGDLLSHAARHPVGPAADGSPVTVTTRVGDITALTGADLADGDLITASALLDMLTGPEIDRVVDACAGSGAPALLTLSVIGHVELDPPEEFDHTVAAAFNDHQRRETGGRRLLGPDAADAAVAAFVRRRIGVRAAPSPWRLGPDRCALAAEWFRGWVEAAVEQDPQLAGPATAYARRRLADANAGRLGVTVGHRDLLSGL